MKKILAILLLSVMLFNLVGYRLLFNYLDNKAQLSMVKQLDDNSYSNAGLIEIKVPLKLPYAIGWESYERFDGTIELNGVSYNYVERKIQNDTLFLHCLPNTQESRLKNAQTEYAKNVSDAQTPQQGHKGNAPSLFKSLLMEFTGLNTNDHFIVYADKLKAYNTTNEKITADRFISSPEQPPELV